MNQNTNINRNPLCGRWKVKGEYTYYSFLDNEVCVIEDLYWNPKAMICIRWFTTQKSRDDDIELTLWEAYRDKWWVHDVIIIDESNCCFIRRQKIIFLRRVAIEVREYNP